MRAPVRCVGAAGIALVAACESTRVAPSNTQSAASFPSSAKADSVLDAAEAAYRRSEYDSATMLLSSGRTVAVRSGDSVSVARADTWLGLTSWKQGKNERARSLGEAALAMKLRIGDKEGLFRSHNALGLLAWEEGRFSDADDLFAKARASAEAAGDSVGIAKAIGNRGLVHADAGDFDKARSEFELLRRVAHARGDTIVEGNALSNLGMVEIRSGDPAAAISFLTRARSLYSAVGSPGGEESVLGQLGSAYETMAQPQKAIAYLDSAMVIARSHDLVREEAEDLQIYAELLGEAGDHQAALRHLARARILADSAGLGSRVGDMVRAQARELTSISRNDLALSRAKEAIDIHMKTGARFEELADHLLVAEIAQAVHESDEVRRQMAQADKLARTLGVPVAMENLSLGRARVADLAGDPAAVLSALPGDAAFPRMGPRADGEAQALRARAFARLRQWPEAASAGLKAIESLDMVRQGLGEGPLRAAFTSDKSQVYADLVIALLQLGRSGEAFQVADAARGKALLEHLSAMRGAARATSGDLVETDRLLRRIDYLTEKLRLADTVKSPDRSPALRKDLRDLTDKLAFARKEYEDRISTVARTDPRGSTLMGVGTTNARDVQKALAPNEVLIEYLATPGRLFIFGATRDTVVATSSPVALDDLANRVRLASGLSGAAGNPRASDNIMRSLFDILIAPVKTTGVMKPGMTLVLVPQSALAYLPFAALIGPNGRRLIEMHSLLELPSAGALPFIRTDQAASSAAGAIFAPFPEELVGTRQEAIAVGRVTPRSTSFIGRKATEGQLRTVLASRGIVHIASHAVLDQVNPMFSHIELASTRNANPEDDGSLEVHELLRIPVHSDLVYLSGCETGAGASWSTSFRRSQDYATLSQAMLYAGARNVIATLWRIDDLGASVFAQKFYTALAANGAIDALAIAQREMIHDARYAAPRYWAGYTISGAGDKASSRSGQNLGVLKTSPQTGLRVSVH